MDTECWWFFKRKCLEGDIKNNFRYGNQKFIYTEFKEDPLIKGSFCNCISNHHTASVDNRPKLYSWNTWALILSLRSLKLCKKLSWHQPWYLWSLSAWLSTNISPGLCEACQLGCRQTSALVYVKPVGLAVDKHQPWSLWSLSDKQPQVCLVVARFIIFFFLENCEDHWTQQRFLRWKKWLCSTFYLLSRWATNKFTTPTCLWYLNLSFKLCCVHVAGPTFNAINALWHVVARATTTPFSHSHKERGVEGRSAGQVFRSLQRKGLE